MNDLIDEILAEMPDPAAALDGEFTNLDDQVPYPERLPAGQWVEILNDAKEEFEVDGAATVFSWRVGLPLDIGDIEVADGIHARAGRLALDARITDDRAARPLDSLLGGEFLLKLKFLREQQEGEWAV
ncbi:MAG: hypothetical protein AB2556_25565 [Candidatus Thiodiazotropha sp.]